MVALKGNNIKNDKITFPVSFDLKAIMDNSIDKEENLKNLKSLLLKEGIQYGNYNFKYSSSDKYISISIGIKIENKAQMDSLYQEINNIPGIKYAV